MSVREDAEEILDFVYDHRDRRPTVETISEALDFSIHYVNDCLQYLDDHELIETNNPFGEGLVVWDITTEGIDRVEGNGSQGGSDIASQNTISNVDSEQFVFQQNFNSDNPSQSAEGDRNTNFTINTQAGLADLMAPFFKWLIGILGFKVTSAIGSLSLLLGAIGVYWSTQTYNSLTWTGEKALIQFAIGIPLVIGLTFAFGFILNRCSECGAFFSSVPIGEAEIVDRQERSSKPDLLKVGQEYNCNECGKTETRTKNISENDL